MLLIIINIILKNYKINIHSNSYLNVNNDIDYFIYLILFLLHNICEISIIYNY